MTTNAAVAGGSSPEGSVSVYKPTLRSALGGRGPIAAIPIFYFPVLGVISLITARDVGTRLWGICLVLLGLLVVWKALSDLFGKRLTITDSGILYLSPSRPPLTIGWHEIGEVLLQRSDSAKQVGSSIWLWPINAKTFVEDKPEAYRKEWAKSRAFPYLGICLSTESLAMPWEAAFADFTGRKPARVLQLSECWYVPVQLREPERESPTEDLVFPATGNWLAWTAFSAVGSVILALIWFFVLGSTRDAALISAIIGLGLFGLFTSAAVAHFTSKTVLEKEGWSTSNIFGVRRSMRWDEVSKVLIRIQPRLGWMTLHVVRKEFDGIPIEGYGAGKMSIYEAQVGQWSNSRPVVEAAGVTFPVGADQMPLEELGQEIVRRIEADRLARQGSEV